MKHRHPRMVYPLLDFFKDKCLAILIRNNIFNKLVKVKDNRNDVLWSKNEKVPWDIRKNWKKFGSSNNCKFFKNVGIETLEDNK